MPPKRVLLIEDNAGMRRTLAAHLTSAGYTVGEAVNTDAAYGLFRAQRPDVVLLDADLARGNAFELVGKLRGEPNGHETPLVLLSRPDRDDMAIIMQAVDANAVQAVLHKPLNLTELVSTLAANCEKIALVKRTEARVHAELGLKVKCKEWDRFIQLYTKDISRGGMFLAAANPPPVMTRLRVQFELPGTAKPFILHGEVAHAIDSERAKAEGRQAGMGIRFLDLTEEVRTGLEALIEQSTQVRFAKGTAPQAAEQPVDDGDSDMLKPKTVPPKLQAVRSPAVIHEAAAGRVPRTMPPAPPGGKPRAATQPPTGLSLDSPFGAGVAIGASTTSGKATRQTLSNLSHDDLFADVPSMKAAHIERARELLAEGSWQDAERLLSTMGEAVRSRQDYRMASEWAAGLRARDEGRLEDALGHLGWVASQAGAGEIINRDLAACQAAIASARKNRGFFGKVLGR